MTPRPDYFDRYETLKFERSEDGVLVVRLHWEDGPAIYRPDKHHAEWAPAFTDIGMDRDNRVVIITGTGDVFINEHASREKPLRSANDWDRPIWTEKTMIRRLLEIEAPVIAAVNGPATIHAELVVLSDIVLAAEHATFADLGHFPVGEVPGDGVQHVWQELLGTNRGRYFLLTGQILDAREAKDLGVVNEVLPAEDVLPRALEFAHQMATYSDLTLRYTRLVLIDRWKRVFADEMGVGYGMALQAISTFDRGWLVWDGSNKGKESYDNLQRLHARGEESVDTH
jgi:enoyl-CoA hydratase/carnithine racemase